jgi:glycosyltransferase involved in cell wall biosynthesis
MCKYTFLLPAYKAKFLKIALDSILAQSYHDFAVLISDDCSPDDIKSIVAECQDERIKYRRNSKNIGAEKLVEHWNQLVSMAESEYVIMASDDDVYELSFLEKIDELVQKYPYVDVFRARVRRINADGETTAEDDLYSEYMPELDALYYMYHSNYIGCIANYVFKTSSLQKKGGFVDFPYAWPSDSATAIHLSSHGVCNTQEVLFSFRLSQINISDTTHDKKMERGKLKAMLMFDEWMSEYVSKLEYEKNTINENRFKEMVHGYKSMVFTLIGYYAASVNIVEWFKMLKKLKRHKYFSKATFMKNYLLSFLVRNSSRH